MTTPLTQDLARQDLDHLVHPHTPLQDHARSGPVAIITEGQGVYITDTDGNRYIDGLAGLWNVNVGHGRREIADAAAEQMTKLAFSPTFFGLSHVKAIELSGKLAEIAPPGLGRFFYTSGGSESTETALKIARYYHRCRGNREKFKIIARRFAYHGVSYGALSATGLEHYWTNYGPLVPGFSHIMAPYCFRCELNLTYPRCDMACAKVLEDEIVDLGPETVAAFIAEPVQGAGGVIVPPPEYWPMVRAICSKYDVLLIADEVITGFGRTGKMFAVTHWDVQPDILSTAKGITSGYLPLGAVAITDRVYDGISSSEAIFAHGFTYNGHPVCCAAALANIAIIEREGLVENSRRQGERLRQGLAEAAGLPHVGEVRGMGLVAAVELVADKQTGRAFDPAQKVGLRTAARLRSKGIMCRSLRDILAFSPPLCISEAEVDTLTGKVVEAIAEIEA